MAGSTFGEIFRITTWGESHGKGIGVVVDGCPAGLPLTEKDIQAFLDRRRPGQSLFTTQRREDDTAQIWSGVFEGRTTGCPISILIPNTDQRSRDYGNIMDIYRPGHADYTYDAKYGIRDYRGGGRSSGRETIGRVAAGAIASKILKEMGVTVQAYAQAIGPAKVDPSRIDLSVMYDNPFYMPDPVAAQEAVEAARAAIGSKDSMGGVVRCTVDGLPAGIGDPCFDKLDGLLAKAVMSIGAVKAVEIGDGIRVSETRGSQNNDSYTTVDGVPVKKTNHGGGIYGGISDGDQVVLTAYFKPTPSIARPQMARNNRGEVEEVIITGRHDPLIVPRAVVVVESMTAITILDAMMKNMSATLDGMKKFYRK